jgi:putative toxin-antitoxin system antitoxin component (TIGR02293 family)
MLQDLAERLESASEGVGFDQADFARVLETSPRTVSRWLHRETAPRAEARERLLEILYVFDQLSRVLKPEAAHDWLLTPNEMLGHDKPVDLLAAGEYRRVLGVVEALAEGVFV